MSHYLLPSTPIYGHVAPMITVGRALLARGHRATVLTGSKFRRAVEASGLGFQALPTEVDYDDANLGDWLPRRGQYSGIAAGRHDIIGMFIRPIPAQHQALVDALNAQQFDAVVADAAYLGVLPTLLGAPVGDRIPVVGISATPLSLRSTDCAPFGSGLLPGGSARTRLRNRQINFLLDHGPLRAIQRELDTVLRRLGVAQPILNYFDHAAVFDATFHLSVAGFEYPRRELPASVQFVGPLHPEPLSSGNAQPTWWHELDGRRPVVHVTQGTMANIDLSQLIAPTLRALAHEDVLVVASTGGQSADALPTLLGGRLPDNARVAEFLPYAELLPKIDVMITNGGFGGVQRALAYGLPLVVAGATEDKPEVAARVAWSGAGLNLRTARPTPRRLRKAVRTALYDPRYRQAAQRLQYEIAARGDPLAHISDDLEILVRATPVRSLSLSESAHGALRQAQGTWGLSKPLG